MDEPSASKLWRRRLTRRELIVVFVLLGVIAAISISRMPGGRVPVGELLGRAGASSVELRLYELDGKTPVATLTVAAGSAEMGRLGTIIDAGESRWRRSGPTSRVDLTDESFRVDIAAAACVTRISVGGSVHMTYADGREARAASPRHKRLYDRLGEFIKAGGKVGAPESGP